MKDSEFKTLPHRVGINWIASRGAEVAEGYKPDLTVKNQNDDVVFVVESEQKTDRKAFLGDLVKAEKYAEDCCAHPVLVIVMQPFDNTTVQQIADHLAPYAAWLAQLKGGTLQLSEILVISDAEYQRSVQANEGLGSEQFRARATRVSFAVPLQAGGGERE
jgi:hypothetical protein